MEKLTFKIDNRSLIAFRFGKGKTIVGLSGFGCTHEIFLEIAECLSKQFQVILIENRGMGDSDKTNSDYEIKDLALDAKYILDQLKISEYGVMGISMGGFIAQELTLLNPIEAKALALLCTTSSGSDFFRPTALTEEGLRYFSNLDPLIAAEYGTIATTHPSLKIKNSEQFNKIVHMRANSRANIDEQIRQNNSAIRFLSGKIDLADIKCPTLAMCGEDDRFVSPKNLDSFKSIIKNCTKQIIPESDHFFFMEKPLEVAKVLNQFFSESI